MFSFGWSEIALTVIIIVIIVGPKEIPNLLKQIGSFSKSIKKISREFKKSLNDIAEEGDLKDVKDSISEIKNIKKDLDPTQEIKKDLETIKDTAEVFEKEIKDLKKASISNISKIASETSSELVKKIINTEVNKSNVSAVVEDIIKRNIEKTT